MADDDRKLTIGDRVRMLRNGAYHGTIWHIYKVDFNAKAVTLRLKGKSQPQLTVSFADIEVVD